MLLMGDRSGSGGKDILNGDATSLLTCAIYFPRDEVDYLGNFSGVGGCTQVVADTIQWSVIQRLQSSGVHYDMIFDGDGSGEVAWRSGPPADLVEALRMCGIDPDAWRHAAEQPWSAQ